MGQSLTGDSCGWTLPKRVVPEEEVETVGEGEGVEVGVVGHPEVLREEGEGVS